MNEITVWERKDKKTDKWKHNHIEAGHIIALVPCGSLWQTEVWATCEWRFSHCFLNENDKVVKTKDG